MSGQSSRTLRVVVRPSNYYGSEKKFSEATRTGDSVDTASRKARPGAETQSINKPASPGKAVVQKFAAACTAAALPRPRDEQRSPHRLRSASGARGARGGAAVAAPPARARMPAATRRSLGSLLFLGAAWSDSAAAGGAAGSRRGRARADAAADAPLDVVSGGGASFALPAFECRRPQVYRLRGILPGGERSEPLPLLQVQVVQLLPCFGKRRRIVSTSRGDLQLPFDRYL